MDSPAENAGIIDIVRWQETLPDGISGPVKNPMGEEGIMSKKDEATQWFPLGKGQNAADLFPIVGQFNEALTTGKPLDPELRDKLQAEADKLALPKERDSTLE